LSSTGRNWIGEEADPAAVAVVRVLAVEGAHAEAAVEVPQRAASVVSRKSAWPSMRTATASEVGTSTKSTVFESPRRLARR
jgi:hypothetical protein